jgi:hypothetical protein
MSPAYFRFGGVKLDESQSVKDHDIKTGAVLEVFLTHEDEEEAPGPASLATSQQDHPITEDSISEDINV